MIDLAILIAALGFFIMMVCAGVALIMRARGPRVSQQAAPPATVRKVTLEDRLDEVRRERFSVPQAEVRVDTPLDMLRAPEDYKGPHRRTPNIRRSAKDRRYYKRRQDPEMFGRRGTGNKDKERDDDGTTEGQQGR